jgi:hypothetical protein
MTELYRSSAQNIKDHGHRTRCKGPGLTARVCRVATRELWHNSNNGIASLASKRPKHGATLRTGSSPSIWRYSEGREVRIKQPNTTLTTRCALLAAASSSDTVRRTRTRPDLGSYDAETKEEEQPRSSMQSREALWRRRRATRPRLQRCAGSGIPPWESSVRARWPLRRQNHTQTLLDRYILRVRRRLSFHHTASLGFHQRQAHHVEATRVTCVVPPNVAPPTAAP